MNKNKDKKSKVTEDSEIVSEYCGGMRILPDEDTRKIEVYRKSLIGLIGMCDHARRALDYLEVVKNSDKPNQEAFEKCLDEIREVEKYL